MSCIYCDASIHGCRLHAFLGPTPERYLLGYDENGDKILESDDDDFRRRAKETLEKEPKR